MNIGQYNNNCTSFDENLLYKPKKEYVTDNPEFSTQLTFDESSRKHDLKNNYSTIDYILVLGDLLQWLGC